MTDAATTAPVEALYAAFAAGDIPAAIAGFDPGIVWNEAENVKYADGNPYVGPDAVVSGVFARIGGDFDGFTATPKTFLPSGVHVAVLGRYGGVHRETGRALDAPFVHVFTVADGRITSFQQYTDTVGWQTAMGG